LREWESMIAREEITTRLLARAPAWQPRAMAAICFASAAVQAYATIFPVRDELDVTARVAAIGLTLTAGTVYWLAARFFRVWMVHTIVAAGLGWGLLGLGLTDNEISMVFTLTTLLWTCILVGLVFPPVVTRIYAVYVCLGLGVALAFNQVDDELAAGVLFAASFVVTMEILTRMSTRLRIAATTDALTGFLNRAGLDREVERLRRFEGDEVALLMVDLDGFKDLNDREGHLEGDRRLRQFGRAWLENVRAGDLVARIGGDEFVVVSPQSDLGQAREQAKRLREKSPLSWSGGVVVSRDGESLESMIARADRLLYAEKTVKKGRPGPAMEPDGESFRSGDGPGTREMLFRAERRGR